MHALVFDTETTGLTKHPQADLSSQPRIIEFGALLTDGVNIIDTLEFICDPKMSIDPVITKITGLTDLDLKGRPEFHTFIPKIREFCSRADVAIAHNLSFDRSILKYDLERDACDLEGICFPKIQICTVEESQPIFGRRVKLSELYEYYCGPYVQKHRALDDVRLLHQVASSIGVYRSLGMVE